MSQRESGYERVERDLYETPAWVTEALLPHLMMQMPPNSTIWEPAAGSGKMVRPLGKTGCPVFGTDIATGVDFLDTPELPMSVLGRADVVVTNPPYSHARQFIEQALSLMAPGGIVAMLLRTDYDHAKTRAHLFAEHRAFAKKLVLTKRIVWFERPGAAPSFNHAWYIWDWKHSGPPTLAYEP